MPALRVGVGERSFRESSLIRALDLKASVSGPSALRAASSSSQCEFAKPDSDRADVIDFWDVGNRQDWIIHASVRRDMRSCVHYSGYGRSKDRFSLDTRRNVGDRLGPVPDGSSATT
jgi:hypothetical protein